MKPFIAIRALSLLLLLALTSLLPQGAEGYSEDIYGLSFICILFGHYVLQILFSSKKWQFFGPLDGSAPQRLLWLTLRLVLLAGLFALSQTSPFLNIAVYFGIHFVLAEVFDPAFSRQSTELKACRLLTCASLYALFVQSQWPFSELSASTYFFIFGTGLAGLVAMGAWTMAFYELLGIVFILFYSPTSRPLFDVIFAHLLWWMFYPLKELGQSHFQYSRALRYAGISFSVTGAFVLGSLWSPAFYSYIYSGATFYGNIHITLSFALSASHPWFINQVFGKAAFKKTADLRRAS